jgi:hypothetical protein
MPADIVAVNLASYHRFQNGAYAHLQRLGVRHVEIGVPAPDRVETVQRELKEHGLSASTLMCPCDLGDADPETMRPHLEAGRAMGVSLFFISAKGRRFAQAGSVPPFARAGRTRGRLRHHARARNPPDLAENATEARATLTPSATRACAGTWTRRTCPTTTTT